MKLRILIADDEPLARERLRGLLRQMADLEIVSEAANGVETVAAIERERPDVVLLDVQMPACDGLQVAARISTAPRPAIIFVTAHEHFAVEAFAVYAVDYLLKPFDHGRLERALARAANHILARRNGDLDTRLETLLAAADPRKPERFAVRCDGRVVFVWSAEIVWIEAVRNYSCLHLLDRRRVRVRESLASLEQRLGTACFFRVNRSAIARIDHIQELQPAGYGDTVVVLRDTTRLSLSRDRRGSIERRIQAAR